MPEFRPDQIVKEAIIVTSKLADYWERVTCPYFRGVSTDFGYCASFNFGSLSAAYRNATPMLDDREPVGDTK